MFALKKRKKKLNKITLYRLANAMKSDSNKSKYKNKHEKKGNRQQNNNNKSSVKNHFIKC